uniref:Uncharacterized protein n=1 Tax=Ditylum brightwellii TaxID=49249 RepID=A0A7S4SST2_9STRA|mmetsp:Transcript_36294/g.48634  ORF Transcript_36294/g.48634 Transcript_36294/m.48634 type:complete len:395 (+) Transcript_36294:219-1403(+)
MSQKNFYQVLFSSSSTISTNNEGSHRQEVTASTTTANETADFHHPPSPPSGIEHLFLTPELSTSNISAFHLASEIKKEHRASSIVGRGSISFGSKSAKTEEFLSACDSPENLREEQNLDGLAGLDESFSTPSNSVHLPSKVEEESPSDLLSDTKENFEEKFEAVTTEEELLEVQISVEEVSEEPENTEEKAAAEPENTKEEAIVKSRDIMTDTKTPEEVVVAPPAVDKKVEEKKEELHIDASQHVYETVKNVWGFGKNIFFAKPLLELTEAIATKVVGELKDVDDAIKPHVANIDDSFFNPAVNAIVSLVMPAVEKVDPIVRPVYVTILRPFGLFKETQPLALEAAPTPTPETKEEKVEVPQKSEKIVIEKIEDKKEESSEPEVTTPSATPLVQ